MSADAPPEGETREKRAVRWAAEHRRRAALVADCTTWEERALRRHQHRELRDAILEALGFGSDEEVGSHRAGLARQ